MSVLRNAHLWLLLSVAATVHASPEKIPHGTVELISAVRSVGLGSNFQVGLHFQLEPGWHVYWKNPGDSGQPPKLTWTLPDGWSASDFEWPAPKRLPLASLLDYGYEGNVLLPLTIQPSPAPSKGTTELKGSLRVLVCREVCVPGHADLSLTLPIHAGRSQLDSRNTPLFAAAQKQMPQALPSGIKVSAQADASTTTLSIAGLTGANSPVSFLPAEHGRIENAAPQTTTAAQDGSTLLKLKNAADSTPSAGDLEGILLVQAAGKTNAYDISAPVSVVPGSAKPTSPSPVPASAPVSKNGLLTVLGLAFGGGLILNLMPCVFPVLSIKVLSLLSHAGGERRAIQANAIYYTVGVLFSFWLLVGVLLGLRVAGRSLGWGFQLQSPGFVTFLVCLLFTLGLSLIGAFEIGASFMNFGSGLASGENTYKSSFFTGILATVVATPCTAPLMGVAVGYALSEPAVVCFLVFTSMALGLAFPFLLLSVLPQLSSFLPRPGRWMEVLKQAMAFPVFGTVIWLLWVLGQQIGITELAIVLFALLLLGVAAWLAGRWPQSNLATALACLLGLVTTGYACTTVRVLPSETPAERTVGTAGAGLQWEAFSTQKLDAYRAQGHPVLVDFTAAWCLTCQVNDRILFHSNSVQQRLQQSKIALLRADWTSYDPQITAVLAQYGRSSIPLYVLYGSQPNGQPVMLPDGVLAPSTLLSALRDLKL